MALMETAIKAAKPKDKPYMLWDDRGLWLLIVPGGGKYWRLRYWVEGKEKKVSLGTYPSVTLREARERRDTLHKSRAEGLDPAEAMRGRKSPSESTFGHMAREWLDKQIRGGLYAEVRPRRIKPIGAFNLSGSRRARYPRDNGPRSAARLSGYRRSG